MYVVSVVTLTRTDTTLDHGQKAEKVCLASAQGRYSIIFTKSADLAPRVIAGCGGRGCGGGKSVRA